VSPASISRHLNQAGYITPQPHKRPKSSCIRCASEPPNERWQADFTTGGWPTELTSRSSAGSTTTPATRYALCVSAHRITGAIVLATFQKANGAQGIPASTLTDNGTAFTTRLSGGKGGRNKLENELRRLGVTQINSPHHLTTCGKVGVFTDQEGCGIHEARPPETAHSALNLSGGFSGL
jgi:transposase InsO family protein